MSRMSELDAAITELRKAGEAIINAADAIREAFSGEDEQVSAPQETEQRAARNYSLEDVRAALLQKTRAGFKDAVKELLRSHGAERLPDIDPSEYSAIMSEAEDIGQ